MKRLLAVLATTALVLALSASPASAAPHEKATGSVGLANPAQWALFDAHNTNPDHGTFEYTNFEYPGPGSGVWVPGSTLIVEFEYLGTGPYTHVLTVDTVQHVSPTATLFSGTGTYPQDPNWTTTFNGNIEGDQFTLYLTEIGYGGEFHLVATGTVAGGNIVDGAWYDDYPAGDYSILRTGTFEVTGAFSEVLHYVAPVTEYDTTSLGNGSMVATTPFGPLTIHLHDAGSPGSSGDTMGWLGNTYNVVDGNLTVFE
jgi:hypothetical protein